MFSSTDDAANVVQTVAVQQQSERTVPTEFDDFSTSPSADLLKKMRLYVGQSSHPPTKKQKIVEESEKVSSRVAKSKKQSDKLSKDKNLAGPSIDLSEPRVSLDKYKVVPNVEMRDADKASAASKEKLSLSKSDLDEIKSYVRTYVDIKFNDLQKLMVDQYTGLLGVVKEGFASFGKVAQYPVHESEKGNPNIEEDPFQSLNEHTMDAKSYNVVDVAGQSSKLGGNEGAAEESLKEAESSYADKLQQDDRHSTDAEVDKAIKKERESKEALHNTYEDLSKAITLYIPPLCVAYPTGINYIDAVTIDTCDRQGNVDSQCYISDNAITAISQVSVCKTNLKYVRKLPSKRNRQSSKVYQSPFVNEFDSGSKDKEVI
ncbi:hypothetical protein P3S67_014419 [Capsicum chacoense]